MAMFITDDCIGCAVCVPDCPNEAISVGQFIFIIDAEKCNECVGFNDSSNCVDVCPADCIFPVVN